MKIGSSVVTTNVLVATGGSSVVFTDGSTTLAGTTVVIAGVSVAAGGVAETPISPEDGDIPQEARVYRNGPCPSLCPRCSLATNHSI